MKSQMKKLARVAMPENLLITFMNLVCNCSHRGIGIFDNMVLIYVTADIMYGLNSTLADLNGVLCYFESQ